MKNQSGCLNWRSVAVGACGLLFCASTAQKSFAADYYVVDRKQILCVLDHLESYLSSAKKVAVIIASKCPKAAHTDDDILEASQNMLPAVGDFPKGVQVDSVLVFQKPHLKCLLAYKASIAGAATQHVSIPKSPCRLTSKPE